ncbi:MAG TPA: NAD(P)-dependent oxidoreductase [Chloroflexota bacterium]|jgi:nucleoside-diphosphate-sugar epimerase|nr:NAD(P)-dependent oxidoreductase [Chloroflexota bacterium]
MAILITGAGLIGAHTAQRLLERGVQPVLYDVAPVRPYLQAVLDVARVPLVRGDIRDLPQLMQVVREYQPDVIVHTAGLIGNRVEEAPYTGLQINIQGTINVLEAARVLGVRRVIFASTEGVYDRSQAMDPAKRLPETAPYGYNPLYGATKAANELLGHAYADRFQVDFIALRFSAVFGPGTFAGGSVAGEFIHDLLTAAIDRRPVQVRPWPARREYTYVKDIACGVELACFAEGLRHRIFNLGVGRTYTLEEIVEAVRRVEPGAQITIAGPPNEALARALRNSPFDISRAREELGWEPQYDLESALRDYAAVLRRSRWETAARG